MSEATNFGLGVLLLAALIGAVLFETNYRKAGTMFQRGLPQNVRDTIAKTIQLAALKTVVNYIDTLMEMPTADREAALATMRKAVETGDLSLVSQAVNVQFTL